jgi:hypothetical protein
MSNIIDSTYFERGSTYVPNNKDISVQPVGSPTNQTELDFYITEYERDLLLNALGVTLYAELQLALVDLPASDQKWQDLVDGKTYNDVNGNAKIWDGLSGVNKQSTISFYVFTEYLRNYEVTYTTVGTVKNTAKNATNFDATPKYIKAYTQFISSYQGSLNQSPTVLINGRGMIGFDYSGSNSSEVSLYQYLLDQNALDETSFPDFEDYFRFYEMQNSKGF